MNSKAERAGDPLATCSMQGKPASSPNDLTPESLLQIAGTFDLECTGNCDLARLRIFHSKVLNEGISCSWKSNVKVSAIPWTQMTRPVLDTWGALRRCTVSLDNSNIQYGIHLSSFLNDIYGAYTLGLEVVQPGTSTALTSVASSTSPPAVSKPPNKTIDTVPSP